MALRNRNAVMLFKAESTEGTDASPTGSADAVAVQVSDSPVTPSVKIIQTDEATGSLDGLGSIVGGMSVDIGFDVLLKGSGTAGTAPQFGKILKCAGWAETVTASAVPASAAAATAGSSTGATGGTDFTATADLYNGMPMLLAVNPSAGATTFITDYTAAKVFSFTDEYDTDLDTTTTLQIPINVRYLPASSSISSATIYLYIDGIVWKIVGARARSMSLSLEAGGIGRLSFVFAGMFSAKADASVPTATLETTRPPVWRGGVGGAMLVNRLAVALRTFSIDNGITGAFPDNPNSTEGFDAYQIVSRRITGNMDPLERLVATDDVMADFRAGTNRIIAARVGSTAGNRFGITIPQGLYLDHRPGNRDGFATVGIPFEAVGVDSGVAITQY